MEIRDGDQDHWARRIGVFLQRHPIVTAFTLLLLAFGPVGLSMVHQVQRDRTQQATDRKIYAAAYRICQRQAVDRAFAHSAVDPGYRLFVEQRLPILDCRPNLFNLPAKPLPREMQKDFVRRFQDGKLTRAEQGLCPTSLENLERAFDC